MNVDIRGWFDIGIAFSWNCRFLDGWPVDSNDTFSFPFFHQNICIIPEDAHIVFLWTWTWTVIVCACTVYLCAYAVSCLLCSNRNKNNFFSRLFENFYCCWYRLFGYQVSTSHQRNTDVSFQKIYFQEYNWFKWRFSFNGSPPRPNRCKYSFSLCRILSCSFYLSKKVWSLTQFT